MENSEIKAADAATPGQRLREARERAGISPREMADRLNWLPSHVTAIEEDRYETLRSPAFVRGYLRAYAKSLGLQADELIAGFDSMFGNGGEDERTLVLPTSPASNQKTGVSVMMGSVIAVLVIAAIWWQSQSEPETSGSRLPAAAETESTAAMTPSRSASPDSAIDAASTEDAVSRMPDLEPVTERAMGGAGDRASDSDDAAGSDELTDAATVDTGDTVGSGVVTDDTASADDEPVVVDEPVAALADSEDIEAAPANRVTAALEFGFSDDCWLEVRDAAGTLIYADLRQAGDTVSLDGDAPFNVLAGNAAAVTLRYRGEPFPVRARPGRDLARFTVGEP